MDIQTKTICDDDYQCDICYYNSPENGYYQHKGKHITQLISCDYIAFGDYDNSCAVERANVRYLEEKDLIAHRETFNYGGVKAWLLDNEGNRELLESLENYPCFDDELVSQIEMEIETEYIADNDDIWRATPEPLKSVLDDLDRRSIDPELYYMAKEEANAEFIVEAGGNGYIDLEKLAPTYNRLILDRNPELHALCTMREVADDVPAFPESLTYYGESAAEMQHNKTVMFQGYSQEEARALAAYAAELEALIDKLKRGGL